MLRRFAALIFLLVISNCGFAADAAKIPSISGDLGDCSAEFTVTDVKLKPIYNANVHVQLRWGFGGFHRTDLDIGTNSDGKAKVEGLPERPRQPLAFTASYQGRSTTVVVDPRDQCKGSYKAILPDKPYQPPADSDTDEK